MATLEQCKAALQKRFKTRQDVLDFYMSWGGQHLDTTSTNWTDEEFIRVHIDMIVGDAHVNNSLDQLGLKLGLSSDAEASRLDTVWTNRRSWIAIAISFVALFLSIIAFTRSSTPNEKGDAEASPNEENH